MLTLGALSRCFFCGGCGGIGLRPRSGLTSKGIAFFHAIRPASVVAFSRRVLVPAGQLRRLAKRRRLQWGICATGRFGRDGKVEECRSGSFISVRKKLEVVVGFLLEIPRLHSDRVRLA